MGLAVQKGSPHNAMWYAFGWSNSATPISLWLLSWDLFLTHANILQHRLALEYNFIFKNYIQTNLLSMMRDVKTDNRQENIRRKNTLIYVFSSVVLVTNDIITRHQTKFLDTVWWWKENKTINIKGILNTSLT